MIQYPRRRIYRPAPRPRQSIAGGIIKAFVILWLFCAGLGAIATVAILLLSEIGFFNA